jgi:carbamoyl-phosphate synthase large subunit
MHTVLVTGVGAIIGYGAVRSLRKSRTDVRIVGMDIYQDAVGQVWCDSFAVAVPAADPGYVSFLTELIRRHRIDLVIPAIEQDALRMSDERRYLEPSGARFALNTADLITTAHDKWSMHNRLCAAGLPAIPSAVDGTFDQLSARFGLPFIVKPRRGYASRGLVRVGTQDDCRYWRAKLGDEFMAQQIVGDDDDEYTVGAFGLGDGTVTGRLILRRTLARDGSTAKAWVSADPSLDAAVDALATLFRPVGPTNFQFRRHQGSYLLLEINPRVSSSTSLRAAFGVNDAAMCVEYFLEGRTPSPRPAATGFAVRYIEDVVIHDRDHL